METSPDERMEYIKLEHDPFPLAGDINWMETLLLSLTRFTVMTTFPLAGDINWMETEWRINSHLHMLLIGSHSLGTLIEWKQTAYTQGGSLPRN